MALLVLGIGFAVGSFLGPDLQNAGPAAEAGVASSGASSGNGDTSNTTSGGHLAATTTKQEASSPKDLDSIFKESNTFRQTVDFAAYVESLRPEDLPAAVREVEKKGDFFSKGQLLSLLVGRWVDIDPQGVKAEIANTATDRDVRNTLINGLYGVLADQDSADAVNQAQQLPTKQERDMAMGAIIGRIAQQDPEQALTLYKQKGGDPYYNFSDGIYSIFSSWVDKDLNQATQAALHLPLRLRQMAMEAIANNLSSKDMQTAMGWVNQLPKGSMQNMARESMMRTLSYTDPQAALDYIKTMPQNGTKANLVQNIAFQLVQSDPKAGMALIDGLPSADAARARRQAIFSWSWSDPKAAAEYAATLPQNSGRNDLIANVAQSWARNDPQAALAWANQLPDDDGKTRAISDALGSWASTDPARASAYTQSMPDGAAKQKAMSSIAINWANNDPSAAAQWIATSPDGPDKNNAYSGIAGSWARSDPVQAGNWLTQLPSSPARDAAVSTFSNQILNSDPERAEQWAASIGDPKARENAMTSVLRRWMQKDPAAATPAVQNSTLSEDQKKQILQLKTTP